MKVEVIDTSELGDRSYVVHDGSTAVVIDPQRDIDRVQSALEDGVSIAAVAETHIHNDYVTGGLELAKQAGADYLVCADNEVDFDRRPVSDGDVLSFGELEVRVIATPGHTHEHLSYAVSQRGDDRVAVFTGGSLLYGSVGRTDLVSEDATDELTRAQYRSARKLVADLPDSAEVFPTHGFGSFCSSGSAAGGDSSTIGEEKKRNDALTEDDEDTFVTKLVENLTAYPSYYAHMGARNAEGPGPIDLSPPESVDAAELRRRIDAGDWVVDLRDRKVYPTGHVRGTVGFDLGAQFATYLGWLIPWGTPVTLIGESPRSRSPTRSASSCGSASTAPPAPPPATSPRWPATRSSPAIPASASRTWPRSCRTTPRARPRRSCSTYAVTTSAPTRRSPARPTSRSTTCIDRLDDVPSGELWVHCASGIRSAIAASILERAGHDVVLIDDAFDEAVELGLTESSD